MGAGGGPINEWDDDVSHLPPPPFDFQTGILGHAGARTFRCF